jgi:hypothetical protein
MVSGRFDSGLSFWAMVPNRKDRKMIKVDDKVMVIGASEYAGQEGIVFATTYSVGDPNKTTIEVMVDFGDSDELFQANELIKIS